MLPPSLCTLWTSSRFLHFITKQTSLHPFDFVRNLFHLLFLIQIKPETLYLEEEVTNNVELADTDRRFHASARNTGIRYKVCGESETSIGESSNTVRQVWSTPPSWTVPTRGRSSAPLESPKRNISEQSSSGVAESTF